MAWQVVPLLVVVVVAGAVKWAAAHAGASELGCLLGPTAALVSLFTGHSFVLEAGAGYTSRELYVVIAPACAGVNFAIIAFTTLALAFTGRFATGRTRAAWLLACAPLAYLATLGANALRITVALGLGRHALGALVSESDQHRAIGAGVYLVCLLLLHATAGAALGRRPRSAAVPLASYLAITLVVPLLGGAARQAAFGAHAAVVLGAAGFAAAVLWLLGRLAQGSQRALGRVGEQAARPAGSLARLGVAQRHAQRPVPGAGDARLLSAVD